MGDHRASIVAKFEMHGIKRECDMWINWSPDDSTGIDERVREFFASAAKEALDKYRADQWEYDRERRDAEKEKAELEELARLKAKYENR